MSVEIRSHYYNYYNVKGRYSPDTPEKTSWEKLYEDNNDKIKSNNFSKDGDSYKALMKLEDIYYDIGASNRAKYSSYSELQQALYEKYFFLSGGYTDKYTYSQRKAMYDNELSMSAFGYCSNFSDPRLGGPVYGETDSEVKSYNRQAVGNQLNGIIKNAGIDLNFFKSRQISFSIDPYNYRLIVIDLDDNDKIKHRLEEALNSGSNSKEFFFHILKSIGSGNINKDVLAKYRLASCLKEYTGYELSQFKYTENGLVNDKGENILDVLREGIKQSNDVPAMFKGAAFDYVKEILDSLSGKDLRFIPDLNLTIGYKNGILSDEKNSDVIKSGFYAAV